MDPIKYIFKKPTLSERIARWEMVLTEYDIQYTTQKEIKGGQIWGMPVVYWISYSVKIIFHLAILPERAGFLKMYLIGSILDIRKVV